VSNHSEDRRGQTTSSLETALFARNGEVWTLGYHGRLFPLRHVKGLSYIQHLLLHPQEEFWAQDLASEPPEVQSLERLEADLPIRAPADLGPMLDPQAKLEYRSKLQELRQEVEEEGERGNVQRAEEIKNEIDFLQRELAHALGLHNRDRRAGSPAERARLNVTRAIKSAVQRILAHDTELGNLLARSLRTGTHCSYSPGSGEHLRWQFSIDPVAVPKPASAPILLLRQQSIFGHALIGRTAFVGREAERSRLRLMLDQAAGGQGSVVMLGGAAGIGKTRMVAEVASEAVGRGFLALGGCCYDREDAIPFIPVIEILEAAFSQTPEPEMFRQSLGEHAPEIARLMPQLQRLFQDIPAPLPVAPEQSRRILFEAILSVLAHCAARRPMLLVFEDLHWADQATLSLLRHLGRSISVLPAIIIGTYRDDEIDIEGALAKTLNDLRRIHVLQELRMRGLPEDGVAQMLRALSEREPPGSIVNLIGGVTEGNPLFIEEIFRHLTEKGKLLDSFGEFRREVEFSPADVPQSVRLVIGRRLGELNSEARQLLALAAVVGHSFSFDLLKQAAAIDSDELVLDLVDQAEKAGLISTSFEGPEPRLQFSHELITQTLVAGLSPPRLQSFHLRVANAIERIHADTLHDQVPELAHHLSQAGNRADPGKAIKYMALAGNRALIQGAYDTALHGLQRALDLLGKIPASEERLKLELDLQIDYGTALRAVRGWNVFEFGSAYGRAHAICQTLHNDTTLFRVLSGLWSFHLVRGEHHKARGYSEEMVQMAPHMPDRGILVQAFWALGCSQFFMGDLRGAHASFRQADEHYDREKDRALALHFGQDPCMSSLCFDAMTLWLMGYGDQAGKQEQESLKLARALRHPFSLVWCLSNLGKYHTMRRDYATAHSAIDEALRLCAEHRFGFYQGMNLTYWGISMALQGRFAELKSSPRQPPKVVDSDDGISQTYMYSALAESFARAGKIDRANSLLDKAAELASRNQERYVEPEIHRVLGDTILKRAEFQHMTTPLVENSYLEAEQCFRRAIELANNAHAKMLELRATVSLAQLWARTGRTDEARRLLTQTYDWFSEGFDVPDLRDARALGERLAIKMG
jgi:tetratricopeptide (TPR) repeat protein